MYHALNQIDNQVGLVISDRAMSRFLDSVSLDKACTECSTANTTPGRESISEHLDGDAKQIGEERETFLQFSGWTFANYDTSSSRHAVRRL